MFGLHSKHCAVQTLLTWITAKMQIVRDYFIVLGLTFGGRGGGTPGFRVELE